jgi:prepilin-type N-terminal cleavage/methylation domain-containing protein
LQKSRAFTLIELLVVIAIIAILAAILFPVFAQAKAAAKAAAAMSNSKQLTLSHLMYQNDYDDAFAQGTSWNTGNDPLCFGAGACFSTWAWITAPYVKSANLLNDPTTAADGAYFGWGPAITNSTFPEFGYNYAFLSPFINVPTSTTSSQAANPSNTVMMTSKWVHSDQANWQGGTVWLVGPIPGGVMEDGAAESVECGALAQNCFSDWGQGDAWDNAGLFGIIPETEGRITGGNAFRVSNQITVGWVDGHAKKASYGTLSTGTNFNYNAPNGSAGGNGNITMLHAQQYPWSLTKDCSQWLYAEGNGCTL